MANRCVRHFCHPDRAQRRMPQVQIMLAVNGHAKHRQSLCRVGYGKTALSMDLFFITTANILSTHTFLLLSLVLSIDKTVLYPQKDTRTKPYAHKGDQRDTATSGIPPKQHKATQATPLYSPQAQQRKRHPQRGQRLQVSIKSRSLTSPCQRQP